MAPCMGWQYHRCYMDDAAKMIRVNLFKTQINLPFSSSISTFLSLLVHFIYIWYISLFAHRFLYRLVFLPWSLYPLQRFVTVCAMHVLRIWLRVCSRIRALHCFDRAHGLPWVWFTSTAYACNFILAIQFFHTSMIWGCLQLGGPCITDVTHLRFDLASQLFFKSFRVMLKPEITTEEVSWQTSSLIMLF